MQITFDTKLFDGRPKSLTNVLHYLSSARCITPTHLAEVEEITCRTPSDALRYCKFFTGTRGVSPSSEIVFLKNPSLGVRYLKMVKRKHFVDEKIQKRFWKKVVKKPELALEWSMAFGVRLSESEEEVFIKDMRCMQQYANNVIKQPYSEKIHQMIVLKSFDSNLSQWQQRYLKDYITFAERFRKNNS
jgi:hypothetical protein